VRATAAGKELPENQDQPDLCRQSDPDAVLSGYHKGAIVMNLIAFCSPTHVYWSDSCPFGLGGYSNEGYAWRLEIPDDL
jgi:hypothetical protein